MATRSAMRASPPSWRRRRRRKVRCRRRLECWRSSRRSTSATLTQINDAGCAALAAALDSGAFPALEVVYMNGIPASAAEEAVVCTGAHSLESRHLRDGPRPAARCECVALIISPLACLVPRRACEVSSPQVRRVKLFYPLVN